MSDPVYPESLPLQVSACRLPGEPLPFAAATALAFRPFRVGDRWGGPWETWWFRLRAEVPSAWRGRPLVVRVDLADSQVGFGGEGLVWSASGEPLQGLSSRHTEVPVSDGQVDLFVEAAANPPGRPAPPAGVRAGPLQYTLTRADLAVRDEEQYGLWLDLVVAAELAEVVSPAAADRIRRAVADAQSAADPGAARRALASAMGGQACGRHRAVAVGHSHIDTAWLWPIRETVRKCARTYATAVSLMERSPDYRFACSCPQHLAWMQAVYPALFERIRTQVSAGRFEPVGAMWVEPDCNLPSGESLVRQMLYGRQYWRDELGVDVSELWLPDVFGYPANLPQLIEQAGLSAFVTQKLSWNDTNRFPYQSFLWEGIDGTRVFTHFPPADTYGAQVVPAELARLHDNVRTRDVLDTSLFLFGFGDGGGGPTEEMLERLRRLADAPELPRLSLGSVADFFCAVRSEPAFASLPVWRGELYFELHRGTYTSQARTKVANRRGELELRAAELWSVAAATDYPADELRSAWRDLLICQMHDILPGSAVEWVYQEAGAIQSRVREVAARLALAAQQRVADEAGTAGFAEPVVVFNAAPVARAEVADVDGRPVWVEVPALGWAVVDAARPGLPTHVQPVRLDGRRAENGLLSFSWDEEGLLTSVADLVTGRELLQPGRRGNQLQLLVDEPRQWDAWDVDREAFDQVTDVTAAESVDVTADAFQLQVQVDRTIGTSRVRQTYVLRAGSPRLDVRTWVDWRERHRLLKAAFPVDVHAAAARCEVQFGYVERPTHTNTSWDAAKFEICAHRWAELGEPGFGVALLNDGRYGYDVQRGALRLSLLRGPEWPDPTADLGEHEFVYSLLAHHGDLAEVVAEGWCLNVPLTFLPAGGPGLPGAARVVEVAAPGVFVEAVKQAEDGDGVVVRVYEAVGGRAHGTLRTSLPVTRAVPVNLMEEPVGDEVPLLDGAWPVELRPFRVASWRLR
jgi:alpha-mannosidase